MPAFAKQTDIEYTFVIKRTATGQFKNLWSLQVKGPSDDQAVTVVDNDNLSTVIAKIGYIFEQDGL